MNNRKIVIIICVYVYNLIVYYLIEMCGFDRESINSMLTSGKVINTGYKVFAKLSISCSFEIHRAFNTNGENRSNYSIEFLFERDMLTSVALDRLKY